MEEAPTCLDQTKNEISKSMKIEQNDFIYLLIITIKGNSVEIKLYENEEIRSHYYTKEMTIEEIKEIHKIFCGLSSCNEFLEYIEALINNKKVSIKKEKDEDIISINLMVDYLLKSQIINIPLTYSEINLSNSINDIYKELHLFKIIINKQNKEIEILKQENILLKSKIENQNNENNNLKKDIELLKDEINTIKNQFNTSEKINNNLLYKNSLIIMCENESDMINSAIEDRMNKKIKDIKKLYQASFDGGDPINFHNKCDNIPNTLVLIKTKANRRFGGFTSAKWESFSPWVYKEDKKAFLFSLDKKRIYSCRNINKAICCYKNRGPTFGSGHDFSISGNPIKDKNLYTRESESGCSYDFGKDKNALSEDGNCKTIYAEDYEVYQIIF